MSEAFSEKIEFPLKVTHNITEKKSTRLLHIHDNGFELLFFIAGKVTYFYETSIYTMQPGDILLVPPDTIHGYQTHEDSYYERIPLHIQRNLMLSLSTEKTSLLDAFQDPEHRIVHLSKPEMNQFIYYTDTIIKLNEEKPYGYDILIHAYLLILLLIVNTAYRNTYSTAKDISPAVIRNALDYINAHLTDNLTVQSIADELGISSSRLSHLFKEHTGSSVWNYVMVKRLLLARALLMEGKAVIDACYESGFRDYSHFNKAFSKTFHIAPGRFLKEQHLAETV